MKTCAREKEERVLVQQVFCTPFLISVFCLEIERVRSPVDAE